MNRVFVQLQLSTGKRRYLTGKGKLFTITTVKQRLLPQTVTHQQQRIADGIHKCKGKHPA